MSRVNETSLNGPTDLVVVRRSGKAESRKAAHLSRSMVLSFPKGLLSGTIEDTDGVSTQQGQVIALLVVASHSILTRTRGD